MRIQQRRRWSDGGGAHNKKIIGWDARYIINAKLYV